MKLTARDIDNQVLAQHPMTFRNDNGMAYVGGRKEQSGSDIIIVNPHRIKYGLFPGSGDRIGWLPVRITQADVGRIIAQFLSVEIKTRTDRMSQEQMNWADAVVRDGGSAEIWKDTAKGLEVCAWPTR